MPNFNKYSSIVFFDGTSAIVMDSYDYKNCDYKEDLELMKCFNDFDSAFEYAEHKNETEIFD